MSILHLTINTENKKTNNVNGVTLEKIKRKYETKQKKKANINSG